MPGGWGENHKNGIGVLGPVCVKDYYFRVFFRQRLTADLSLVYGIIDWLFIISALVTITVCYSVYLLRADELIHSDMATEILTGIEMLRQKTIFLKEYYHSTEIFLVRSSLFVAVWSIATDSMLSAFRLAIITDIVLQVICFLYMVRRLGAGYKASLLGLLAYFGARAYTGGEFVGMAGSSYGTMCATVFLVLGRYAAFMSKEKGFIDTVVRFAIPILAFIFGMSSVRFLSTVFVPLVLAHIGMKMWSRMPQNFWGDRVLRELLIWTAICIAGVLVTRSFIIPKGFGPIPFQTLAVNGLVMVVTDNVPAMIYQFLKYNPVVLSMERFRILSLPGINGLFCFTFYLSCLFGFLLTLKSTFPTRETVYRFFLISLLLTALSIVVLLDTISIYLRHMYLAFVLVAVIVSICYRDLIARRSWLARVFLVITCSFLTINSIYNIRVFPNMVLANNSRIVVRHMPEIENSLIRHGVKRAYSLYWNSAVETVLTDGRIEVWGVLGNMKPIRYLTSYQVYSPMLAGEKSAFINVNKPPYSVFENMIQFSVSNIELLNKAVSKEIIPDAEADIEIFYFDHNPFVYPQGHDPSQDYVPAELVH